MKNENQNIQPLSILLGILLAILILFSPYLKSQFDLKNKAKVENSSSDSTQDQRNDSNHQTSLQNDVYQVTPSATVEKIPTETENESFFNFHALLSSIQTNVAEFIGAYFSVLLQTIIAPNAP